MTATAATETETPAALLDSFTALEAHVQSELQRIRQETNQRHEATIEPLEAELAELENEQRTMREKVQQAGLDATLSGNFDALDTLQQRANRLPLLIRSVQISLARAKLEDAQQRRAALASVVSEARPRMIALVDQQQQVQRARDKATGRVQSTQAAHGDALQQERRLQQELQQLLGK